MYESLGNKMLPGTKDAMIFAALAKAPSKEFEEDINEARRQNKSLQWLIERLSRTNAQGHMQRLITKSQPSAFRKTHRPEFEEDDAEFAGLTRGLARQRLGHHCTVANCHSCHVADTTPQCSACGKSNHALKDCWQDIVCTKCGRIGHPASHCRWSKPADSKVKKEKNARTVAFK
eukprot:gene12916-16452_t